MIPIKWAKKFYKQSGNEIAKNFSLLLNLKVTFLESEYQEVQFERLVATLPSSLVVSKLHIEQDYQAEGSLLFSKQDAIVMGCLLAMYSETTLEAKVASSSFDNSELDAFREICNQLVGCVDRVLTESVPRKIHIRLGDTQIRENKEEGQNAIRHLFVSGNLINFPYHLKLEKKRDTFFSFLFPATLLAQFDEKTETVVAQAAAQNDIPKNLSDISHSENGSQVLLVRLNESSDPSLQDLFTEKMIPFSYVHSLSQLKDRIAHSSVKLIVIQTDEQIKKAIDLCQKITFVCHQTPVPIWLQGSDWNQELIIKAVQVGASYLIVTPLNRELVEQRISQVLLK